MAGNRAKTLSCPACGGAVTVRAAGHTVSAVCAHCSTVIDTANDSFRIIKQNQEQSRDTAIPIGARGILDRVTWEVIGYVEKRDVSTHGRWDEYLLYNPYFGFRFLVQSDNHWSLARLIKRDIPLAGAANKIEFDGDSFDVFYRGQSEVEYVKGEFYWRVRKGERENHTDYIAPPRMLSLEKTGQELTLSLAQYLHPAEIEKAFGVTLPRREGVAPNQPKPFADILKIWLVAVCACIAAFIVQLNSGQEQLIHGASFHVDPLNSVKSFTTTFAVPSRSNVVVDSVTTLRNNWIDLDLTLVNDETNVAYEASQAAEYYFGIDDGEGWSEGSTAGETYFPPVDPGTYRLVVEPTPGAVGPEGLDIGVTIKHHVPVWGNFWVIVLFILALPVYAGFYRSYFEHRRWSNSDYTPGGNKASDHD